MVRQRRERKISNNPVVRILSKVDYFANRKHVFEQMMPAIMMIFTGLMTRKKIMDERKKTLILSDVTLHLWRLMLRDKMDFSVKPQQLAMFLMRDVTYTVGWHFQMNRPKPYTELNELEAGCIWAFEHGGYCADQDCIAMQHHEHEKDVDFLLEDMEKKAKDWRNRYSDILGRPISKTLYKLILRHLQYEAAVEYLR